MIIGPDIGEVVEAAKRQVAALFVRQAEQDGTPPTLRAMYVMKAAEARIVAEGGESELITQEAGMRGVTPQALAETILQMSAESQQMELARTRVNVSIEKASSEAEIVKILKSLGIDFAYNNPA